MKSSGRRVRSVLFHLTDWTVSEPRLRFIETPTIIKRLEPTFVVCALVMFEPLLWLNEVLSSVTASV